MLVLVEFMTCSCVPHNSGIIVLKQDGWSAVTSSKQVVGIAIVVVDAVIVHRELDVMS